MKITDRRIMQTTQIATVVMCGLLIGYLIAEVSHSIQDWLLLTSLTVVLVCSLFVMFRHLEAGCLEAPREGNPWLSSFGWGLSYPGWGPVTLSPMAEAKLSISGQSDCEPILEWTNSA